jgi:hypothetical protein
MLNKKGRTKAEAKAIDVDITDDSIDVTLVDGRRVSAPLEWFPRLRNVSPKQRLNWGFIGPGIGIHWEEIDEDISVRSLLATEEYMRQCGLIPVPVAPALSTCRKFSPNTQILSLPKSAWSAKIAHATPWTKPALRYSICRNYSARGNLPANAARGSIIILAKTRMPFVDRRL